MKKTLITASAALLLGLAIGFFLFRNHPPTEGGHDHGNASSGGDGEAAAKDEVWTCSMHPQVKAPKPGLCPICAMDLIPLSAMGGGDGERSFSMSEAAKALAGITTVEVSRSHPEAEVRLYGKIVYDETTMRTVAARFPARIDRLFVDYTGIRVEKGDHLAILYSPDLLSAQTELLTAKKFDNQKAVGVARDKLRLWGFSEKRIAEIETSGKTSDQLMVDAPTSGIVTHKNVNEGDYVQTGTPFFRIADLDEVWVLLDAYESDTPWLRFGQEIAFTTESIPGRTFDGRISFISPELDPATRTVAVRVNVANEDRLLKPGMFVSGIVHAKVAGVGQVLDPSLAGKWISPMHPEVIKDGPGQCDVCGMDLVPAEKLGYVASTDKSEPPLVIPVSAVLHTGKRSVVYVELPDTEQPTFEGREILIGPRAGDQYIVEAGLKPGERVVAAGGFVIDSALQIQAKKSMMLPGDGEGERLFPEAPAPDDFLTETDALLESYYAIQSALAADSLESAQKSADAFLNKLKGISTEELPPPSADVWKELSRRLVEALSSIQAREEVKPFRADFQTLTLLVDEMVRRFGTANLPVFVHYCPMAFDDTGGSWLQPDENLLNPYFGSTMLRCGEIREQIATAKSIPLNEEGNRVVSELVATYFDLQKALAADSTDEATKSAQALAGLATKLKDASKANPQGAFLLQSIQETLTSSVQSIIDTDSLAQQRVGFKSVSAAMEQLAASFGEGLSQSIYKAHCPMAFNDQGADWLQPNEDILNPYFGSKMLKCGEIKEQLTGAKVDGNTEQ